MNAPVEIATLEYAPHARQAAFHEAPQASRWFCAGYGSGKTDALVIEALINATVHHPGFTGIVAAPTYPLLFQSWFEAWKRLVPRAWWQLKKDPYEGPHILVQTQDHGASKVYLRSTSNPWSNEGINAAWLCYDEASRERERGAIDVLSSRIRRGYPGRQRGQCFAGPPMTRKHWTAAQFGTGPDAAHVGDAMQWSGGDHAVVRAATWDNPFLPPDYVEKMRSRPGASRGWVRQWMGAEFGGVEGQVYECFSRDVHVVPAASLAGRTWGRTRVGVDWGWTAPGTMIVIPEGDVGDLFVIAEEVHRQKNVDALPGGWIPIARKLCDEHSIEAFDCDPSAPGNMQALRKGVREGVLRRALVVAGNNDHGEGIRRVTARLEAALDRAKNPRRRVPALYVSDACQHTIEEFESWRRKSARDGSLTEDPEDANDHALDAIRYRIMSQKDAA